MKYRIHKLVLSKNTENFENEFKKASKEEINEPEKGMLQTPLFTAVLQGKVEATKLLIKYGAEVNALDVYGRPPLYYIGDPSPVESANAENRIQIAKLLLDNGADVNISDVNGTQPLFPVASNAMGEGKGKEELPIVRLFMECGADPNHKNKYGVSPLDFAKKVGYQPLIDILEKNNKI